jgi:hypothetical protein
MTEGASRVVESGAFRRTFVATGERVGAGAGVDLSEWMGSPADVADRPILVAVMR